jgi:hypothetical protein
MMSELRRILTASMTLAMISLGWYAAVVWATNFPVKKGKRLASFCLPYLQSTGNQEGCMLTDYMKSGVGPQILVLGSSHAYRGYDPRLFAADGRTLFCLGTSSQTPVDTAVLVHDLVLPKLSSQQAKPLILLDIYDRLFEMPAFEGTSRLIQNAVQDATAWHHLTAAPDIRLFNAFAVRLATHAGKTEVQTADYVSNGYCSQAPPATDQVPHFLEPFAGRPDQLQAFDAVLGQLVGAGLQVIVVSTPMPQAEGFATYRASFRKEIDPILSHHGVIYLDYTQEHPLQWPNHFGDSHHLNQAGVEVFNPILLERLKLLSAQKAN